MPKSILELMALIKVKLADGVIPPIHADTFSVHHGRGGRCDCCGDTIAEHQFQTDVVLAGTVSCTCMFGALVCGKRRSRNSARPPDHYREH